MRNGKPLRACSGAARRSGGRLGLRLPGVPAGDGGDGGDGGHGG
jgi:hypothetical protein